jgi:transglutaminase-like putative cysteine protease
MLLEVRHVTQYHYERPVRESVMELRMQPQKSARQRLISFELDLDPRAQVSCPTPSTWANGTG